jgi:hypothetical protein
MPIRHEIIGTNCAEINTKGCLQACFHIIIYTAVSVLKICCLNTEISHSKYFFSTMISDFTLVNIWSLHSSGMWGCVTGWLVPDVWRQYSGLIYQEQIVHEDSSFFTDISTLEDETTMMPQNVGHQSPGDATPHPRGMKTSTTLLHKPKNSHHSHLFATVQIRHFQSSSFRILIFICMSCLSFITYSSLLNCSVLLWTVTGITKVHKWQA